MRTSTDRLRHTVFFELILLVICVPLLALLLNKPMGHVGAVSLMLSLAGATWNYIYNYLFDHALVRLNKPLYPRSGLLRTFHAVLFELSLLVITIPAVMIMMNLSFMQALMIDIGFVAFVPVYAFVYNIAYDRLFPLPTAETV
ncbi:PACE efflux transporter [Halodesulfovibrio marinisediminis]|nr:PACE efflux transporter [Halodesulfovibrio marinisediminis]